MVWKNSAASALAFVALLSTGCLTSPATEVVDGRRLFSDNCVPCHGADGAGNYDIEAPAIAGLPEWYVLAQLYKFRDKIRGAHSEDYAGMRMKPMARTLYDEGQVDAVAAYVAGMEDSRGKRVDHVGAGDAAKGATYYATCTACHGPEGAGNELLNAPPIARADDWYILSSLKKFKGGIRGSNPKDITGAQMIGMAGTLPDEQAMLDVIAHIKTLSK
jgi:cytochrome c553